MNGFDTYTVKEMLEAKARELHRDMEEMDRRITQRLDHNDRTVTRELAVLSEKVPTQAQWDVILNRLVALENFKSNAEGRETIADKQYLRQGVKIGAAITGASILLQLAFRYLFKGGP